MKTRNKKEFLDKPEELLKEGKFHIIDKAVGWIVEVKKTSTKFLKSIVELDEEPRRLFLEDDERDEPQ